MLQEKNLYIRKSTLPGAGKGLFTKVLIPKGTLIVEYKGEVLTWKDVEKMPDHRNGYVFFFNNNYVIDAWKHKGFAHFANDAMGIVRVPGFRNNAEYITKGRQCFIKASRDIQAGSEILVGYGGEYWQVIRYNIRHELKKKADASAKKEVSAGLPHQVAARKKLKRKQLSNRS